MVLCHKCRYSEGGFCHFFNSVMTMEKCAAFEYLTMDNKIFPDGASRAPIPHIGSSPPTRDMMTGRSIHVSKPQEVVMEVTDEGIEEGFVYDANSVYQKVDARNKNAYYHSPIDIAEVRGKIEVQEIPGQGDITPSVPQTRMPKRSVEPRPDTDFSTHDYSVLRRYGVEIPAGLKLPFVVKPYERREQIENKKLLISVPHAYGEEHSRDKNVSIIGLNLYYELQRKGFEDTDIVFGNIPRDIVDLNRADSRATDFRQLVDEKIEDADYVIDLHTFPYQDAKYGKYDIAILQPMKYDGTWFGQKLYQILKDKGVNVASMGAFLRDDILMQAVKANKPAVLVEINSETDYKLVSELLADAIYKVLQIGQEDITTGNAGALTGVVLPKKVKKAVEPYVEKGESKKEDTRYATIKRGKVKFPIGSPMDKFLHTKGLPHSHVTIKGGKKIIKRYEIDDDGIENIYFETIPQDAEYAWEDPKARLKWQNDNPSATASQKKGDTTDEVSKR